MNRKERTILVTIVLNSLLVLFKLWLVDRSGSLALRASAVHSITDIAIGGFVLLGLVISRWETARQRTKEGISVVESWTSLAVAVAIFYVGIDIVRDVLLGETPELRNLVPITFASFVTVLIAYFLARYKLYVGRQTGSPALIASGYHSQMDIYAAIVVVVGLAGGALGLPNLDRVAAAVVVVFIFLSGYEIASSALGALRHREGDPNDSHFHAVVTGKRMWRSVLPIMVIFLLFFYGLSGFYIVAPGEAGVVRRFGQIAASSIGPGLHYRLPWPVDRVDVVAVDAVQRVDSPVSLMLTGDENLIAVRLSLHYTIVDPVAFLLNTRAPEVLVAQVSEAAMRQVVAQDTVDALLTVDKALLEEQAATLAQEALDGYAAGLQLISVQLLESSPPPEVADAFRDVASAREDSNTFINEALAYQNEVVPLARGVAQETVQTANADASQKVGRATADATLFSEQQGAYAQAPEATRLRLYLEAVEAILPGVRKFILDSSISLETTDLWIPGDSNLQALPPLP